MARGLGKGLNSLIPEIYDEDFDSNSAQSLEDILNEQSSEESTVEEKNNNSINIDTHKNRKDDSIMTKTVIIEGMMCTHCSGRVEQLLNEIEGATATVDLANKSATVTGDVSDEIIKKIITDAGYTVVEIK